MPSPPPLVSGYDAVDVSALPDGGNFYLGYVDGSWPNADAVRARFPGTRVLTVSTQGTPADIADCESGDLTPQQAADGVKLGKWRTIYTTRSVAALLCSGPLAGVPWQWWAADWTGVPHLPPSPDPDHCTVVACQWAAPSFGSPGPYDCDIALWNYVNPQPPAPPVPPAPPAPKEADMVNAVIFGNEICTAKIPPDGTGVWSQRQTIPGSGWNNELLPTGVNLLVPQQPCLIVAPAAGIAPETLHCFAMRTDGHTEHWWLPLGGKWQGPESE